MFTYHFADAVAVHRGRQCKPAAIVRELAAITPAFETIQGVATMAKHVEVRDRNIPVRPKMADVHTAGEEFGWDDEFGGTVLWDDGNGGDLYWEGEDPVVCIRDQHGRSADVRRCLRETREAIAAYLVREHLP